MSSTITLGEKHPEANIALFRVFHKDQKVTCQIIRNPLRILAFLADPLNNSNKEVRDGGVMIEIPNQEKTSFHIFIAQRQCRKR
jgi:hypothetical protein